MNSIPVNHILSAIGYAHERLLVHPRRRAAWLRKKEPFNFRTPDGLTFRLQPGQYVDHHIFVEGIYERRFLELVRRYFAQSCGGVALDVGANIGNHALFLSDCFASVLCFDPNPVAVARLTQNIELSARRNVQVHAVGLSDRAATLPFRIDEDSLGNSGFVDRPELATAQLPVVVGDDYIEALTIGQVRFLKVDVENHEEAVFRGLRRTIARHRPIVAFEFHGGQLPATVFDSIAAFLPAYVFAEARHAAANASLFKKFKWRVQRAGVPELHRFDRPEARSYENILGFPEDELFTRFETASRLRS